MSTYREIHGKAVKSVSTDPSAETDAGQIWYNTTSNTFKSIVNIAAWSSTAAMSTARGYLGGITGTAAQTAGLAFGGNENPGASTKTEEYNGTGWSAGGALGTGRLSIAGLGIQTAAVGMGGRTAGSGQVDTTEEYNGSSWTAGGALSTARRYLSGAGTLTSGLAFAGTTGGAPGAGTPQTVTEEYNGTAWTGGGALGTARQRGCGTGASQTAAICFGGSVPPVTGNTEIYDGSSWSEQSNMNSGKASGMGFGLSTSAVSTGGETSTASYTSTTETWDGTSWASNPATIATGNQAMAGQGSSTAGIIAGGWKPAPVGNTAQEWNSTANIVTSAAWSSGANFPTSSSSVAGVGPRDAAVGIGGYPAGSPPTGKSFEYNGVAWSAEATLNPNTGTAGVNSAAGTQTAVINSQSNPGPPYPYDAAGEYDGSSWSNAEDRPTANYSDASAGTQTAGLFFGGAASPSSLSNATLSYDGTNWTVEESMSTTRSIACGSGTSTAALAGGGLSVPSPATNTSNSEEYGGESWTAGGTMLAALREHRAGGTQTDTLEFGGRIQGAPPTTFRLNSSTYDGTSWSSGPNLATARGLSGSGNGPVGAIWGAAGYYPGSTPNRTNTTEHFNVETTAINVKTLTQS